jgi:hypothetical protein
MLFAAVLHCPCNAHTSITSIYRGGGLSSITRFQPKGIVTLLPAVGFPVVVLTLQQHKRYTHRCGKQNGHICYS